MLRQHEEGFRHPPPVLRGVLCASGIAGASSVALFFVLLLLAPLPEILAWPLAVLVVTLAMSSIAGLAWSVLTLPPGAPWRRTGLRAAVALCGAALLLLLVLGKQSPGPVAAVGLLGGATALVAAWRPGWRIAGWGAVGAALALPLAGAGIGPTLGGAALGLSGVLLAMDAAA